MAEPESAVLPITPWDSVFAVQFRMGQCSGQVDRLMVIQSRWPTIMLAVPVRICEIFRGCHVGESVSLFARRREPTMTQIISNL
jgi:hypothetical protein